MLLWSCYGIHAKIVLHKTQFPRVDYKIMPLFFLFRGKLRGVSTTRKAQSLRAVLLHGRMHSIAVSEHNAEKKQHRRAL